VFSLTSNVNLFGEFKKMILAITSALLGAVLGLRFKVWILVPAIIFGLVATAVVGLLRGDDVWSIALIMVLVATSLQIGYFVAITVVGLLGRYDIWSIALIMVLVTTSRQIGYLGGLVTRFVIPAARVSRPPSTECR
jgi:hypothetical protein